MRRLLYILAEIVLVWLLLFLPVMAFIYFVVHDELARFILFVIWPPASLFAAVRWAVFGMGRQSLSRGFYDPVRPIATLRQAGLFEDKNAGRTTFAFAWHDTQPRDSIDIVMLLAAELEQQGVSHSNLGTLRVTDGGTRWQASPILGELRIDGHVEADRREDREQVIAGIRDLLQDQLGLKLLEGRR